MLAATPDFGSIGTAIAMVVIAFMQVLEKWKSSKRDKELSAIKKTTDETAVKVEEVRQLGNGNVGEQLKIAMVSAVVLAKVTNLPEHISLANAATEKYVAHERTAMDSKVEAAVVQSKAAQGNDMNTKLIILFSSLVFALTNGVSIAQDGFHPAPAKTIVVNGETYISYRTNDLLLVPVVEVSPTNAIVSPTNTATVLPETIQPIWSLLKGRSGTIGTTLLSWLAVLSAAIAPFAVRIRNRLADAINTQSDKKIDPNGYLLRLFSSTPYRAVAFLLNFINIRFPTLAELERAIALQQEAVAESRQPPRVSSAVRDLQYESRNRQLQELDRLLAEAGKIKAALAGPTVPLPVTPGTKGTI